jgi:K+-sensing histidine kinase KdpD
VSELLDPAVIWPLGLVMAATLLVDRAREARRRARLNRVLHELRRPLHSLALAAGSEPEPGIALPASGALELALLALADLDGAINGVPPRLEPSRVSARALVESALDRWRGIAARSGRALELRWHAGEVSVLVDAQRVAQALDNLLANAIEHGGLLITVEARLCDRGVRIAVGDVGRATRCAESAHGRDGRRGHGLAIAAAIATAHGGRLLFQHGSDRAQATMELPLAPGPLPSALVARAPSAPAGSGNGDRPTAA